VGFEQVSHEDMRHSVVRMGKSGAAFLIDADLGLFLTALHAIDASKGVGLAQTDRFEDPVEVRLMPVAKFPEFDVALAVLIKPDNLFAASRPFQITGTNGADWDNVFLNVRDAHGGPSEMSKVPVESIELDVFTLLGSEKSSCITAEAVGCCEKQCLRLSNKPFNGDSGGPLFDTHGVAHGIIAARGKQVGYAVPVGHVWDEIVQYGRGVLSDSAPFMDEIPERQRRAFLERLEGFQMHLSNSLVGGSATLDEDAWNRSIYSGRNWQMSNFALAVAVHDFSSRNEEVSANSLLASEVAEKIACFADDRRMPRVSQRVANAYRVLLTDRKRHDGFRDSVQVAGSSAVLPYASIVAELFSENTDFPTPIVETGGSSSSLRRFCEGLGLNTIDVATTDRVIGENEIRECAQNGVTDIIEVRVGYDGIVFASQINGPAFTAFEPIDIYHALGANIVVDGEVVGNPYNNWSEFNDDLPDVEIAGFIPSNNQGTRELFEEKVLLAGCEAAGALNHFLGIVEGKSEKTKMIAAEKMCTEVRADGKSSDIDGDYTETLARIDANANGIGIFGLSFYENNTDKLKVATIGGISPSYETIASGEYAVSRPLFMYVKKAHIAVVPGLKEYAEFFVADEIAGPGGPLDTYGLVADSQLYDTRASIANEVTMGQGG
jgi:phosphate transport system substrate-binding protein